jgi:hypothetical protein
MAVASGSIEEYETDAKQSCSPSGTLMVVREGATVDPDTSSSECRALFNSYLRELGSVNKQGRTFDLATKSDKALLKLLARLQNMSLVFSRRLSGLECEVIAESSPVVALDDASRIEMGLLQLRNSELEMRVSSLSTELQRTKRKAFALQDALATNLSGHKGTPCDSELTVRSSEVRYRRLESELRTRILRRDQLRERIISLNDTSEDSKDGCPSVTVPGLIYQQAELVNLCNQIANLQRKLEIARI